MAPGTPCPACSASLPASEYSLHRRRYHSASAARRVCAGCHYASSALADAIAHALLEGHCLTERLPRDSGLAIDGLSVQEQVSATEETSSEGIGFANPVITSGEPVVKEEKLADEEEEEAVDASPPLEAATEGRQEPSRRQDTGSGNTSGPTLAGARLVDFSAFSLPSPTAAIDPSRLDELMEPSECDDEEEDKNSVPKQQSLASQSLKDNFEESSSIDTSSRDNHSDSESEPESDNCEPSPPPSAPNIGLQELLSTHASKKPPASKAPKPKKRSLKCRIKPGKLRCANCRAAVRWSDVRARASRLLGHAIACFAIKPYACSGCGWLATLKSTLRGHAKARCPGATSVLVDRERDEVAVKAALATCFPSHVVAWRGFPGAKLD